MRNVSAANAPTTAVRLVAKAQAAPSSEALVQALVAGERWATDLTWEQHAPMVFRLLERSLGPSGEAEDLTQDVFLRVFSRVHTLKDPNALRSFIYSVAVRILKWELRRRRVRRFLTLSPAGELPELPVRGADAEARQLLKRFYAVLERLSSDERMFFTLRHLEGLTVREMAETTALSAATVKRRLARAQQRVSALVAEDSGLAHYVDQLGASHADEP